MSQGEPAEAVPEPVPAVELWSSAEAASTATPASVQAADPADTASGGAKPPAPLWTTWCTVVTACVLLLVVVLGGTSFTYARWEHPGAWALTAYAAGDLLATGLVAALSLYLLGTLVERYALSTLGETPLVLALLLVLPVLVIGLWHPLAFGHMGLWGRTLARSLL